MRQFFPEDTNLPIYKQKFLTAFFFFFFTNSDHRKDHLGLLVTFNDNQPLNKIDPAVGQHRFNYPPANCVDPCRHILYRLHPLQIHFWQTWYCKTFIAKTRPYG
jgi:hypothetical protein